MSVLRQMKLKKSNNNHFLGLQLLASNPRAAIYTDSSVNSINCELTEEDIQQFSSSYFTTPNKINYIKKTVNPSADSVSEISAQTCLEISKIFDIVLDFNLVFEIHKDTRISDLVALFDPNIKNIVQSYDIRDTLVYSIVDQTEFAAELSALYKLARKDSGKEFLLSHKQKINRFRKTIGTANSSDGVRIYLAKFPNVRYYKKYNQYYLHKEDKDYSGILVYICSNINNNEIDMVTSGVTSQHSIKIFYYNNHLYIEPGLITYYGSSVELELFKNILHCCLKDYDGDVVSIKRDYYDPRKDLENISIESDITIKYKVPIKIRDNGKILTKLLNTFSTTVSAEYTTCSPNVYITPSDVYNSSENYVKTCREMESSKDKITVNISRKHKIRKSTINIVNNSDKDKNFSDRYNVEVHRFPIFASGDSISTWENKVISYFKTLSNNQLDLIDKRDKLICSIYSNKITSNPYFTTPYTSFTYKNILYRSVDNIFSCNIVGTTAFTKIVDLLNVIISVAILSNKNLVEKISKHRNSLVRICTNVVEGLDCFNSFKDNRLPPIVQKIQYSNIKKLLSKSSKKDFIKNCIENPTAENIRYISPKVDIKNFIIDKEYFTSIETTNNLSLSEDSTDSTLLSFDKNNLFNECFRTAFFGRPDKSCTKVKSSCGQLTYSIVDFFEISEKNLLNPSQELIDFFQECVNCTTVILCYLLSQNNPYASRRNFGVPIECLNLINKLETTDFSKVSINKTTSSNVSLSNILNNDISEELVRKDLDMLESYVTEDLAGTNILNVTYPKVDNLIPIISNGFVSTVNNITLVRSSPKRIVGNTLLNTRAEKMPKVLIRNVIGNNLLFNQIQYVSIHKK